MNRLSRFAIGLSLAAAAAFCVAAVAQDQGQDPSQDQDPAAVNVAPSGPSYTTEAPPPQAQEQQGAPAPGPDDQDYAEQPTETAPQPPPALPDYQQPPPPADGYIWTPGYWAWSPTGYYWVPGAWVEPPYAAALWTPGYWGFYGGRYMFYPGHWGLHIGFYGGINYGFGYVGLGYEGGYWRGGHFFYNRMYNHVDARVHNVYSYNAHVNVARGNPRASYRGGTGGVQARPRPSDAAAWHEPTAPRMNSQVQHAQSYSKVQGQYAAQNHGRPAQPAVRQPLRADHNVQPQSRGGGNQQHH
jgi:WXXGXW repeat (2 copies)